MTEVLEKLFAQAPLLKATAEGQAIMQVLESDDVAPEDRRLTPEDFSTGIYDGAWLRYNTGGMKHTLDVIKDGQSIGYVIISDAPRLPAWLLLQMDQLVRDEVLAVAGKVLAQRSSTD